MAGLLNLTGVKESAFDPLTPGGYICEVHEVTMVETAGGENAKLPKGTPMIKIQWRVISDRYGETQVTDVEDKPVDLEKANRRFFSQSIIPPDEVDGQPYQHKDMMLGNIVRLFKSLGYPEEVIGDKKGFNPDFEEMVGKQCLLTVGADMEYGTNPVKGFKPVPETAGSPLL
jgi:hypothetical protein